MKSINFELIGYRGDERCDIMWFWTIPDANYAQIGPMFKTETEAEEWLVQLKDQVFGKGDQ